MTRIYDEEKVRGKKLKPSKICHKTKLPHVFNKWKKKVHNSQMGEVYKVCGDCGARSSKYFFTDGKDECFHHTSNWRAVFLGTNYECPCKEYFAQL